MVLDTHFCRILYLEICSAVKLCEGAGGHCACCAYLSLAANRSSGYGSVSFYESANQAGSGKRLDDVTVFMTVELFGVLEHGRQYPA